MAPAAKWDPELSTPSTLRRVFKDVSVSARQEIRLSERMERKKEKKTEADNAALEVKYLAGYCNVQSWIDAK